MANENRPEYPSGLNQPQPPKKSRLGLILGLVFGAGLIGVLAVGVLLYVGFKSNFNEAFNDDSGLEIVYETSVDRASVGSVCFTTDGRYYAYGTAGFGSSHGVFHKQREDYGPHRVAEHVAEDAQFLVAPTEQEKALEVFTTAGSYGQFGEGATDIKLDSVNKRYIWVCHDTGRILSAARNEFETTTVRSDGPVTKEFEPMGSLAVFYTLLLRPNALDIGPSGQLAVTCDTLPHRPQTEAETKLRGVLKYPPPHSQVITFRFIDGELVKLNELKGHVGSVSCCDFNTSGKLLATGGNDSTIRIWDFETGTEAKKINALAPVTTVQFSPDGEHLLYVTERGHVVLHSIKGGKVHEFQDNVVDPPEKNRRMLRYVEASMSPNGKLVASATGSSVELFDAKTFELLAKKKLGTSGPVDIEWNEDSNRIIVGHTNHVYLLKVDLDD